MILVSVFYFGRDNAWCDGNGQLYVLFALGWAMILVLHLLGSFLIKQIVYPDDDSNTSLIRLGSTRVAMASLALIACGHVLRCSSWFVSLQRDYAMSLLDVGYIGSLIAAAILLFCLIVAFVNWSPTR